MDNSSTVAYYSLGHDITGSEMLLLARILFDLGYLPVQCRNPSWVAIVPREVYDMILHEVSEGDVE